jgi:hypothetical protein
MGGTAALGAACTALLDAHRLAICLLLAIPHDAVIMPPLLTPVDPACGFSPQF